jgi:hypothetical protein
VLSGSLRRMPAAAKALDLADTARNE